MKLFITIMLSLFITTGYSQVVIYGQEMSTVKVDKNNKAYSTADLEFNIKGTDIVHGDTLYHNNQVVVNSNGYPIDYDYVFIKIKPNVYEITSKH